MDKVELRMVLRLGVILTKQGIQLRPIIAQLGEDVEEYRALWNDKERFEALRQKLHCYTEMHREDAEIHKEKHFEAFRDSSVIPRPFSTNPVRRMVSIGGTPCPMMEQDNGTDDHRIFAVTVQDPESTVIWNILRVDRNDTKAFKQTLR